MQNSSDVGLLLAHQRVVVVEMLNECLQAAQSKRIVAILCGAQNAVSEKFTGRFASIE